MKNLRNVILVVFLSTTLWPSFGQDKILDQFKTFAANTTRESVWLHINQHYAQPGDRIWFSAYVFDDGTQRLSAASKVLYVNVVDEAGEVVLDEKIPLEDGRGEGYLQVPDHFQKGVYLIRAYTGWMRNFEPEHFFRDWLWVNLEPQAIVARADTNFNLSELSVKITPEGNLSPVAGLTARYAVELQTKEGQAVSISGEVIDDQGEVVANFTTNDFGYAAFILQAKKRRSYQVSLKSNGQAVALHPLPQVQEEGISMMLNSLATSVRVTFQSNWNTKTSHQYKLLLQSKGTIYLDQLLDFDAQPTQVLNVPVNKLQPGVYQLVLLDEQFEPVAERVFQIYPEFVKADIGLTVGSIGRRERAHATLNLNGSATGSASIADKQLEGTYHPLQPHEVFFMGDVLEGESAEIFSFFDKAFRAPENWDLLLMTKRHPAYNWSEIKNYSFKYPRWPYEKFISAYGQVRNADSLLLGQSLFTFYSFAHSEVIPARTDDYGMFLLPLFDFYGPTNIVGLADKKEISFSGMKIDIESGLPGTSLEEGMFARLREAAIPSIEQERNKLAFKSSYRRLVPELYPATEVADQEREFNPITRNSDDYVLDLREYLSFSSLSEVFVEIGRGIIVRERQGKKVILIFDPVNSRGFDEPALVFINGIPTIDYELVLTLDPEIIETIKLYRSATAQERFGAMGRNGILSINTKDGSLEIPKQENITFTFEGFQYKEQFSNNPFSVGTPTLPDFRHQLYWHSGAIPSAINFTTSDILSDFEIRVVSVDDKGNWSIGTRRFSTMPEQVVEK